MFIPLFGTIERIIRSASKIPSTPVLDSGTFSWIKELEASFPAIRAELDEVLKEQANVPNFQDISKEQRGLTRDSGWKVFIFHSYGVRSARSCERCPRTAEAVAKVPGMKTAFFSILAPGKKIPVHRGPYNGVIRCHLALKIPRNREAARIQIAGVEHGWTEGRCLLFDDTYPHAAWNLSEETRVVLFMDIVRPCYWPVSWLNRIVLKAIMWSPFIRDAQSKYEQWERTFERARSA